MSLIVLFLFFKNILLKKTLKLNHSPTTPNGQI